MARGLLCAHRAWTSGACSPSWEGGKEQRPGEGRVTGLLERQGWTDGGGDGQGEETQT